MKKNYQLFESYLGEVCPDTGDDMAAGTGAVLEHVGHDARGGKYD